MRAGGNRCTTSATHRLAGVPGTREEGLVAIARRLISLGADANLRFPWLHHAVHRPVLWGAVFVVRSLRLATALLEAGADPSDGVTLPLAAGGRRCGDARSSRRSRRGREPAMGHRRERRRCITILHWAKTPKGVRWLLDHGADPDPVFAENGETPLHVVAASWDVTLRYE